MRLRWWQRRQRRKPLTLDQYVASQVQAAADLAITESAFPIPDADPFDVMRLTQELFGWEIEYAEARSILMERLAFRGYLGHLTLPEGGLPQWMTEPPFPTTGDEPG